MIIQDLCSCSLEYTPKHSVETGISVLASRHRRVYSNRLDCDQVFWERVAEGVPVPMRSGRYAFQSGANRQLWCVKVNTSGIISTYLPMRAFILGRSVSLSRHACLRGHVNYRVDLFVWVPG